MANPATVADIQARYWRPLTDQQTTNAATWLEDAWDHLLTKRPNLEAQIDAGTVRESVAVRVVSNMVVRILANPEGKSEEAIDDYRYKRHELVASGILHVTPDELADVTPASTGRRSSVRLVVHGDD